MRENGANKMVKPKLTPEERRELKKQKKIEKKLRKEEKKRQIKRDHLDREIKYGHLTLKKYEKDWRSMLIKTATARMRDELEFAWHNFERVVDCKDFQISLLKDELRDSEEQIMLNFSTHIENMDKLMRIFSDRLLDFREYYDTEVKMLQNLCESETDNTKDCASENLNYLKTMLHQLAVAKRAHERTKKIEYYSRLDEIEVKNQLLLQKLRAHLESKYQHMFNNTKQFIQDYRRHIRERKKKHNLLKDSDDSIQELITQQFQKMKNLYDTLRNLRQRLNDMKQTEGSKLLELQTQRAYFYNSFLALKARLAEDQRHDFNKLAQLSKRSAEVFDYLERLIKKGEMVLKLAAICRKLETQKEKILPFPEIKLEYERAIIQDEEFEEDEKSEAKVMNLFWQKVGLAYAAHFTLIKEREFLQDENLLIGHLQNKDYYTNVPKKTPEEIKDIEEIERKRYQMISDESLSLHKVSSQTRRASMSESAVSFFIIPN